MSERAYLKLGLEFTGTAVPAARAVIRAWRRDHPDLDRGQLTGVAAALWSRPVFDCRMAALLLLADQRALLTAADVPLVERLLRDSIRKAIGWVLREMAKRRPDLVAAWLAPRIRRASGATVREAVKPLPPAQRDELLAAYRAGRPGPGGPTGARG